MRMSFGRLRGILFGSLIAASVAEVQTMAQIPRIGKISLFPIPIRAPRESTLSATRIPIGSGGASDLIKGGSTDSLCEH